MPATVAVVATVLDTIYLSHFAFWLICWLPEGKHSMQVSTTVKAVLSFFLIVECIVVSTHTFLVLFA